MAVVVAAKAVVPVLRWAAARALTSTVLLLASALALAVAVKALGWELLTAMLLKSLLSLRSSKAVCKVVNAYFTADKPETTFSFLLMPLSIAALRGAFRRLPGFGPVI